MQSKRTSKFVKGGSASKMPFSAILENVGWLEFNVPFQHAYGYIRDDFGECKQIIK